MTIHNGTMDAGKITPILIKINEVKKMTGCKSVNTLSKRIENSGFPRPLKIDGVNYWVFTEVYGWIQDRIEQARKKHEVERIYLSDEHAFSSKN